MTEQELFESATALITILEAVYRHQNKENDTSQKFKAV